MDTSFDSKLDMAIEEARNQPALKKFGNFWKGLYYLSPVCRLVNKGRYDEAHYIFREVAKRGR